MHRLHKFYFIVFYSSQRLLCFFSPTLLSCTVLYCIVGESLLPAIEAYLKVANISRGTILSNESDLCTIPINSLASSLTISIHDIPLNAPQLPLIPDVAVQYRCGDNIGFGKTRYGVSKVDYYLVMLYLLYSFIFLSYTQILFNKMGSSFKMIVIAISSDNITYPFFCKVYIRFS